MIGTIKDARSGGFARHAERDVGDWLSPTFGAASIAEIIVARVSG
jgi:hypothetical protein